MLTENKFQNKCLEYAYNNISNRKYKYLGVESNNDFNLFNYVNIDIEKNKDTKMNLITILPSKDIYPNYDSFSYAIISWDNGKYIATKKK